MSKDRGNKGESSEVDLAKSMRKLCKGAFGNMSTDDYNHRVLGTSGRQK